MKDISGLIRQTTSAMAQSVRQGDAQAEAARSTSREAQRLSTAAATEGSRLRQDLDRQRAELEEIAGELQRQHALADAIGEALASLFRQAEALLAAISQQEARGREIELRIQTETERSESGKQTLRVELARWSESRDRLQGAAFESERAIDQMSEQLEALERARDRFESIIHDLRAEGFASMEHHVRESSVEALLADGRERFIRLQLKVEQRAERREELALDIELFDWDEEEAADFETRLAEVGRVTAEPERDKEPRPAERPRAAPVRHTKQKT